MIWGHLPSIWLRAFQKNVNPGNRGGTPRQYRTDQIQRLESIARVTDWAAQIAQKDALVASLRKQSMRPATGYKMSHIAKVAHGSSKPVSK